MNRNDKILYYINKSGIGVEIGPSHNPVASKTKGYKVHIIDHMSKDQLIQKYRNHGVQLENIEEVDFIWKGDSYVDLTGHSKFYDWIIASHVIEHTPNLVGFLNDCDGILKDTGVISLVVPDMRYCFDHFRPISGLGQIIDANFRNPSIHSPGTAAEYFLNVVSKANIIAWNESIHGEYALVHSLRDASSAIDSICNDNTYLDVHAWCFTPNSFRLIINDLNSLGFIPFKEVSFFPTTGCEFYITLGRNGVGLQVERLDMLKTIEQEISSMA